MTPSPLYREIPLTKGQVAIVDADNFEWLNQWKSSAGSYPNIIWILRPARQSNDQRLPLGIRFLCTVRSLVFNRETHAKQTIKTHR